MVIYITMRYVNLCHTSTKRERDLAQPLYKKQSRPLLRTIEAGSYILPSVAESLLLPNV